MLRIVVNGCLGQMGQVLVQLIEDEEDMGLVAAVDSRAQAGMEDSGVLDDIWDYRNKADVIIDFSHPSALDNLLEYALDKGLALIIGTTGYGEGEKKKLEKAGKKIAIFYSANMSLGINLLLSLVSKARSVLGRDYDIEIVEKHHRQKIDAPSGTAYMIADKIRKDSELDLDYVYGRASKNKRRGSKEIGIHALRGGTIVGDHEVVFAGLDEIIEIKHQALSKKVFAKGALEAARFVSQLKPGLYNMDDYLESKN